MKKARSSVCEPFFHCVTGLAAPGKQALSLIVIKLQPDAVRRACLAGFKNRKRDAVWRRTFVARRKPELLTIPMRK